MNAKIKKINAEYEKNAAKIAELQARQKELDKQRTELENLDIVGKSWKTWTLWAWSAAWA